MLNNTIDIRFYKERAKKDEQYLKAYDDFRKDYKVPILAEKFYSVHEHLNLDDADPEVVAEVLKGDFSSPQEQREWPSTQNQWYGWFNKPLCKNDRNDKRFFRPRVQRDCTKQTKNV